MVNVIVNADDFGLNESKTRAIKEAFDLGLISSTTLVGNGEAFDLAVKFAKQDNIQGKIGVHFNLNDGEPLTSDICKCDAFTSNGVFHGNIKRQKPLSKFEKQAIYKELSAQLVRIESVGIKVSHADSHHFIHNCIFIAPIVTKICKEHNIAKIRKHRNIGNIPFYKKIVKNSYNRWLKKQGFITTDYFGMIDDLSSFNFQGVTEIMVHPDYDKDKNLIDANRYEDGYSFGNKLISIKEEYGVELIGYGDLK